MSTRNELEEILNSIVLSNNGIDAVIIFDGRSGLKLISNKKYNNNLISKALFVDSEIIAASLSQINAITVPLKHFSEISNGGEFTHAFFYTKKINLLIYFFEINSCPTHVAFINNCKTNQDVILKYTEKKINEIYKLITSGIL